jgi:hypothetical protein
MSPNYLGRKAMSVILCKILERILASHGGGAGRPSELVNVSQLLGDGILHHPEL